jgi:hypothetical protein
MKKKDRDKMMIIYKCIAIFLVIIMILGIIFGAG